jgi:hypothetical protein
MLPNHAWLVAVILSDLIHHRPPHSLIIPMSQQLSLAPPRFPFQVRGSEGVAKRSLRPMRALVGVTLSDRCNWPQ